MLPTDKSLNALCSTVERFVNSTNETIDINGKRAVASAVEGVSNAKVRTRKIGNEISLEIIFDSEDLPGGRLGWSAKLTDFDFRANDEIALAGGIELSFMEDVEAAGYGVPKRLDPDEEGITWFSYP